MTPSVIYIQPIEGVGKQWVSFPPLQLLFLEKSDTKKIGKYSSRRALPYSHRKEGGPISHVRIDALDAISGMNRCSRPPNLEECRNAKDVSYTLAGDEYRSYILTKGSGIGITPLP